MTAGKILIIMHWKISNNDNSHEPDDEKIIANDLTCILCNIE